jgi:hypothetical protein
VTKSLNFPSWVMRLTRCSVDVSYDPRARRSHEKRQMKIKNAKYNRLNHHEIILIAFQIELFYDIEQFSRMRIIRE